MKNIYFLFILILIHLSVCFQLQSADVVPAYTAMTIPSGQKGMFEITVKGQKNGERITIQPVDYGLTRAGQVTIDLNQNNRYSARKWCDLKPTSLVLNLDEEKKVKVPYSIPPGTPSGEFYMGMQVRNDTSTVIKDGAMQTEVNVSAIVLVILKVPGVAPIVKGEILEHSMEMKDHIPHFKALFKNNGTVSMIAHMGVAIRMPDRSVVDYFLLKGAASQSKDGQAFMLPEGLRDFSAPGNRKLPSGNYIASISAVFGKDKIRVMKRLPFEVKGSDVQPVPPIDDIIPIQRMVAEVPAGAINYTTLSFKNQGFNPVEFSLSSESKSIQFLPEQIKLAPGKVGKFRVRLSVPAFEDPRRDIPIALTMMSEQRETKSLTLEIYAPGTVPEITEEAGDKTSDKGTDGKTEGDEDGKDAKGQDAKDEKAAAKSSGTSNEQTVVVENE